MYRCTQAKLRWPGLRGNVSSELGKQKERPLASLYQQGAIDVGGNMLSKKAIDDVFAINIYECASKLKNRVLFIHGTEDDQVSPFTSLKMHEILAENSELKLIQGSDHWYSSQPWEKELIDSIVDFFQDYKAE